MRFRLALFLAGAVAWPLVGADETILTPIHIDGQTPTMACVVFTDVGACQAVNEGSPAVVAFVFPGDPLALDAPLFWTALTPLTDELTIQLYVRQGGNWVADPDRVDVGTSPLAVEWDLTDMAGREIGFGVAGVLPVSAGPSTVLVSLEQPWLLDGAFFSNVP